MVHPSIPHILGRLTVNSIHDKGGCLMTIKLPLESHKGLEGFCVVLTVHDRLEFAFSVFRISLKDRFSLIGFCGLHAVMKIRVVLFIRLSSHLPVSPYLAGLSHGCSILRIIFSRFWFCLQQLCRGISRDTYFCGTFKYICQIPDLAMNSIGTICDLTQKRLLNECTPFPQRDPCHSCAIWA